MQYIEPVGAQGPTNAFGHDYVDKNAGMGIAGSFLPADMPEHVMIEILNVIAKSGLTPASALTQLAQAVRSQALNYRAAGGTANALTLDLDPDVPSYAAILGTPLTLKTGAGANTGAVTLSVDGLAAVAVTWPDGTALVAGDLPAASLATVRHDGTAFRYFGARSNASVNAAVAAYVPSYVVATWSQSLSDSVLTDITGYTNEAAGLGDATFSGGILTVGAASAGLWAVIFAASHPSAGTEMIAQAMNAGTGGTAIAYNSAKTNIGAPYVTATGILRRANGDKIRCQARQISGGTATVTGRIALIRLGA